MFSMMKFATMLKKFGFLILILFKQNNLLKILINNK